MMINKGFLVYDRGKKIVWAVPHSGPALETPTSRDDRSETVASLCWLKVGGRMVISTMPRKRAMGIDFNRDKPPLSESLEYYPYFMNDEFPEKLQAYREKYAWCAADRNDHNRRLSIYKNFWSAVGETGGTVVFMHTLFTRLKNFPSIMDVVAYEDYGFSRKILAPIIRKINRKYSWFFESISQNYKNSILHQQKRILERVIEIFGSLKDGDVMVEYKKNLHRDIGIIRKYADARKINKLEKNFNSRNFMAAARSALNNCDNPKVTVESIFKGRHARSQIKAMFKRKNVIGIETNAFLNYWYPNETSDIVLDIVNAIKPMRKITNYLQRAGS